MTANHQVAEASGQYLAEAAGQAVPVGYKKTEVGVIPDDWDCLHANEVITFLAGYSFSSKAATNNGTRWLKIANVGINEIKWEAESFLPDSYKETFKEYLLEEGDIVMALTRPLLGEKLKVARLTAIDAPALLNQRVARVVSKSSSENFVYYVVQRLNFIAAMNLAMAGSDPPNIGTKALGNIFVALPVIREQTAIANALSDVDALINELEKLIAKKQDIKTATMQQLLTGRTRLPQFALREDGKQKGYKQSELGEIPEDWDAKSLGELCNLKSGSGITAKNIDDSGIYPCFGGNGLRGFTKNFTHDGNYALIGRQGALCGNVQYVTGKIFASEHALVATPVNTVNPKWLAIYLERMNLNQYSESSAQPGLSAEKLRILKLIVPTESEQTAIATILSDMDTDIQTQQQRLSKTRQIKQGMMQELLTGKTRLVKPTPKENANV